MVNELFIDEWSNLDDQLSRSGWVASTNNSTMNNMIRQYPEMSQSNGEHSQTSYCTQETIPDDMMKTYLRADGRRIE